MALLRKRSMQALGAWALAFTQLFAAAGCRQSTGGSGGTAAASTAAGASAGLNMGQILYDTLHHQYETKGETARAQALENRKTDFINAVNRIIPASVGSNLFPTLMSLLPIVDDGTVERAAKDVDAIVLELLNDQPTIDAIVKLMGTSAPSNLRSQLSGRNRNLLISRLLAYPELEQVSKALFEIVRANDGVDDQGAPNGEKNLLANLQAMLARQLLGFQPSPSTGSSLSQAMDELSEALLQDQPLAAFPNLGDPAWAVRLDVNGNPKVKAAANGMLPVPFVDANVDGVADVNADGNPVDAAGTPITIAPFGADGTRDSYGRAIAPGGGLYFEYFDAKRTLVSEILLLAGELLQKDTAACAVAVMDGVSDRVRNDNGTADPADDYDTLNPDSPILDLTYAQFEVMKRTSTGDLLRGLAEVVKRDPAKFSDMVENLVIALKKATTAAATVPAQPGAGQALLNDLLPMVEDALRPRGRSVSAVRALLDAFNTEQRRLQNLPASFARMMKYHDYRNRILADSTKKSVMQRVVEMMERANTCNVLGGNPSNMADFYLAAMAGDAEVLGIRMSINTINSLVDIGFIRRILCSAITDSDVRALKDFADTGALDAMKPICQVFQRRGEITLLKNIMLGLGRHYDRAMRPTEPMAVAILESGAVEKLFLSIDAMTQVNVPGTTTKVADVLADVLAQMVDSTQPIYDRKNVRVPRLMNLMLTPMDQLSARCAARGLQPKLDTMMGALKDVLFQTYTDGSGKERWKWGALNTSLGKILESLAGIVPANPTDRSAWAYDQQRHMEQLLTGRDMCTIMDMLKTIEASPQKATINRALANLFTPNLNASQDAFGGIVTLLADVLAKKPSSASATIDAQALADVLHFLGRQLDPAANRANGIVELLRKVIRADDGLLILRLARNAFDMGPNGTDEPAIAVLQSVFDDINAAGGGTSGPMTAASLRTTLENVRKFIADQQNGLPNFIARIKSRSR